MSKAFIQKIGYFIPTQISGCQLWMDAADSTTITRSGANVTQWNDKANNYSGPATNNPQYNSNPINSLPTIRFDGASNRYVLISANNYNYSFMTYFMVIRWISGSGGFMGTDTPSNYGRALAVSSPNVQLLLYNQFYTTSIPLTANQPCILSAYFNGTTDFTVILNGTPTVFAVAQGGGNTNTNGFNIGVFNPTNGGNHSFDMGEGIVYSSILNDPQRQSIEGYLAQKWGLVSSLPAGHPGRSQTFYTPGKNPGIAAVPLSIMTYTPYTNLFSPISLGNCQIWLDAADSTTFTLSGSNVSAWRDKTGNGYNVTQATAGSQPTFGANGVVFNGSTSLQYSGSVGIFGNSYTSYVIHTPTNNTDYRQGIISVKDSTTGYDFEIGQFYVWVSGGSIYHQFTTSVNSKTILGINSTTSLGLNYSINGQSFTAGGAGWFGVSSGSLLLIGNSQYSAVGFIGNINEYLLFTRTLTTFEHNQVTGYLAWKWGSQSSLPANHPFKSIPPGRPSQVAGIPLQLRIIPDPWTPLRPLSSGVLPWHWFKGDAGLTTTAWTNFGTSKSNASNVGTITLGNYTQGGSQAGGTNNTCTVSPSGYWNWPGVYQTSYHAIFGVFKLSASLTNGQTWTWKGNSFAGRGYTPQYRITNTSGVFTDDILSQGAFLPLNGVTIDPSTRFYTHSMVWGSTPAVSLLQVGTKIASPNGWTTDYGLGIYNNEYIGFAVAPAQPAGVTMTVCEILLFATNVGYGGPVDLTAQDILDVQSYLARKWGV